MHRQSGILIGLLVIAALRLAGSTTPVAAAPQDQAQRDLKKPTPPITVDRTKLFRASHALIFGVSDYTNGLPSLPGVKLDTAQVSAALQKHGFTIKVVMNPTQPKFDEEMRSFIARYGLEEENRLLIYYAGHGHTIKSPRTGVQGYLVPANTPHPELDRPGFINVAISLDMISVYARAIQSKYALFVFDSCFSGALFTIKRDLMLPPPIAAIAGLAVRQFITSGSADQAVPDKSIFCREFVAALNGAADLTRDGYITGTELGIYLHDNVTRHTVNARGIPMQTPQSAKLWDADYDKGDFVFISPLGDNIQAQASPVPIAPPVAPPKGEEPLPSSTFSAAAGQWVVVDEKRLSLPANEGWLDTRVRVRQGQHLSINASGPQINLGSFGFAGPDGISRNDALRPARDCATGALIARIGNETVCIESARKFTTAADGPLQLGINESNLADNTGAFIIKIVIQEFRP